MCVCVMFTGTHTLCVCVLVLFMLTITNTCCCVSSQKKKKYMKMWLEMCGLLMILCRTQEISNCEDIVSSENMLSLTDKLAERCNIKKLQRLSSVTVRLYACWKILFGHTLLYS